MPVLSEGATVRVFLMRGLLHVHFLGKGVTLDVFLASGLLCVCSWRRGYCACP